MKTTHWVRIRGYLFLVSGLELRQHVKVNCYGIDVLPRFRYTRSGDGGETGKYMPKPIQPSLGVVII
jgi:hypothetical protein